MSYILQRTTLWWCWWDLLALVILVGVGIYCWRNIRKMKDTVENLELRLSGESAEAALADSAETV